MKKINQTTTDIFHQLDAQTASLLRDKLSMEEAVDLAISANYGFDVDYYGFGRNSPKKQTRLFLELGLIDKAKGQEDVPLGLCDFEFTEFGVQVIKQLDKSIANRLRYLRGGISVLVNQLRRVGYQEQRDRILQRVGVTPRHLDDIEVDKLEQVYSDLCQLMEQYRTRKP